MYFNKHTLKAVKEFLKANKFTLSQWWSQSPDLNPIEDISAVPDGRKAQKEATTEDGCSGRTGRVSPWSKVPDFRQSFTAKDFHPSIKTYG